MTTFTLQLSGLDDRTMSILTEFDPPIEDSHPDDPATMVDLIGVLIIQYLDDMLEALDELASGGAAA